VCVNVALRGSDVLGIWSSLPFDYRRQQDNQGQRTAIIPWRRRYAGQVWDSAGEGLGWRGGTTQLSIVIMAYEARLTRVAAEAGVRMLRLGHERKLSVPAVSELH